MDGREGKKMIINGGFFWDQKNGSIIMQDNDTATHCVIMVYPKWYQISRWVKVFRYVINLPH